MRKAMLSVCLTLLLVVAGAAPAAATTGGVAQTDCEFPVTSTDATGTEVTIDEEPERVVTLAPSAAQTMWEIGAEAKVVGVTEHATYLDGAESRTNVSAGGEMAVDAETIVDLEPDIVLAPNATDPETVEHLRGVGLTVYHFEEAKSVEAIQEKTRLIGELTGECDGAEETVAWMDERLSVVEEAVEGQERPDVVYVFFGYTAGNGTFAHDFIERAGGNNVAADAGIESWGQISDEVIVEQNPEWLIRNDGDPEVPDSEAYRGIDAVQNDQVLVLNTSQLNQPAPRVVIPISRMAEAFHPDAFTEANASASAGASGEAGADDDAETSGQPGFGVGAALVALLASLVALRR